MDLNKQGEDTRQEMVTEAGCTDDPDNEDVAPENAANNRTDEDTKTDEPGQTPSRNKKIKLEKKSAGIRRERTRSRTIVA
jgi:hypothetical protein